MSIRLEIATKIYCSIVSNGHIPDVDKCFENADSILAVAKEPKGFFIDAEKYKIAVVGLLAASNYKDKCDPNGEAGNICFTILNNLGEI